MEKNNRAVLAFKIAFTLITLLVVWFIFSNSTEIAEVSGGKSALVTAWLNKALASLGCGFRFSETLVRKLAHFAEYTLLGFWLVLTLRVYTRRVLVHISWPLFLGLATAVTDETLQTFIPGRAGQLRDVCIDFVGVTAGIVCGLVLILIIKALLIVIAQNKKSAGR